jgi:hypothetical protein
VICDAKTWKLIFSPLVPYSVTWCPPMAIVLVDVIGTT